MPPTSVGVPLFLGTVAAYVGQAGGIHGVQGTDQAIVPLVHGVVVGSGHQVKAGVLDVCSQGVRGGELGIAGVGWAVEGGLKAGHGIVGIFDPGLHILEAGAVVVGVCGGVIGVVGLGGMAHNVPAHRQGGGDGGLDLGLCRNTSLLCGAACGERTALPQTEKDENHAEGDENNGSKKIFLAHGGTLPYRTKLV